MFFISVDENPNLKGIVKDAGFAPPAGRNNRTPIQNQQPSNQGKLEENYWFK